MPPSTTIQTAFDSGQLSPRMDGRVDIEQYRKACKRLENFLVFPQGGAITRSGSKYIANAKSDGEARLIPFVISTVSAYVLEFGNEYIRFYKTGAQLAGIDGPNLILNPGFETGNHTNWTANDSTVNSGTKHSGVFSSRLSSTSGEDGAETDQMAVDISKVYQTKGFYNVLSHASGTYTIKVTFRRSNGNPLSVSTLVSVGAATGGWVQFSKTLGPGGDFEFPANTAGITLQATISSGGNLIAHIDDFELFETDTAVEVETPYQTSDLFELDFAQTNDVMYITHPDHAPRKLSRISDTEWILHEVNFDTEPLIDDFFTIDDPTAITQIPTPEAFAKDKTAIFSDTDNTTFTFVDGEIGRVLFAGQRRASILWAVTGSVTQQVFGKIIDPFITDDTAFSASELSIAGTPFGSLNPSSAGAVGDVITLTSNVNGNTAAVLTSETLWVNSPADNTLYYWNVNPTTNPDEVAWHGDFLRERTNPANIANVGEWGYGNLDTLGFNTIYIRTPLDTDPTELFNSQDHNAILRVDTTGSAAQLFRKEDEGKYIQINDGLVKITTFQGAVVVRGVVVQALDSASATTIWTLLTSYWNDADYPGAVVFHENRLVLGGSPTFPNTFWGSEVGFYEKFQPGVSDADSYVFTLNARKSSLIRWLESRDVLVAGLEDSEWQIGLRNDIITPSSIFVRRQTIHGCANIQSVVAEKSILFVERGGKNVRELNFNFESEDYIAPDKTLLSETVGGSSGFKQIDVQNRPFPVVWVVNNDGQLVGMTYIRDQGLQAWHVHETGATALGVSDGSDAYESVAVIPNLTDETVDEVWVVVKRTIDGATVRFVEQFEKPLDIDAVVTDPRMLDAFVVDTNLNATVSGLDRFDNDVVTAIIDGDPDKIETHAVVAGDITLSEAPTVNVVVGLPYTPLIQTMRVNAPGPVGTSQAQIKRISKVWLRLFNSLGLKCGATEDKVTELNLAASTPINEEDFYTFASDGFFEGDVEFEDYAGGNERAGFVFIIQDKPLPATVTALVMEVDTT